MDLERDRRHHHHHKRLKEKKRKDRSQERKKKKRHSSSSSDSSSSSSSSSDSGNDKSRKEIRKQRKIQSRIEKKQRKDAKKLAKQLKHGKFCTAPDGTTASAAAASCSSTSDFSVPLDLMNNKARAPQSKEEYEARQKIIRKVVDPETGRTRLIKGDGEIIEEIVSRDRHKDINKQATAGDGRNFQNRTIGWAIDDL